jgi:hypothetical protein
MTPSLTRRSQGKLELKHDFFQRDQQAALQVEKLGVRWISSVGNADSSPPVKKGSHNRWRVAHDVSRVAAGVERAQSFWSYG